MITREQLESALDDQTKDPYKTRNIDHKVTAIVLLRQRIPYDICRCIIGGAEHDVLYLCDVEDALPYLSEEDLHVLADCNCWIDDDVDSIALFA